MTGYTDDTEVYFGKDRENTNETIPATQKTV
jgi:hypothetical protein